MAEVPCCNPTDHEILLAILATENESFERLFQVIQAINGSGGGGGGGNVNLTGINGVAPAVGNGASNTGTLRVTIASDSTGTVAVTGAVTSSPTIGALTDRSGTITTGSVSQVLAPANATRKYFVIENVSSEPLWINFGVAAVQNQPSFKILPNGYFFMESSYVSNQAINIIGNSTGQAFTAKESI